MTSTDIEVPRGNTYRVAGWAFPFDLAGSSVVLSITWSRGSLSKSTEDDGLVVESVTLDGQPYWVVWWQPTEAESLQIPEGAVARYVLERVISGSEERNYFEGKVIGTRIAGPTRIHRLTLPDGDEILMVLGAGPIGPIDRSYTDAQLAALKGDAPAGRDTLKGLSDAVDEARAYADQSAFVRALIFG